MDPSLPAKAKRLRQPFKRFMLHLISYLIVLICAFVLMLLVDDNPHHVTLLEYLMFAIMLYCGYAMFKIMVKIWQDENGDI